MKFKERRGHFTLFCPHVPCTQAWDAMANQCSPTSKILPPVLSRGIDCLANKELGCSVGVITTELYNGVHLGLLPESGGAINGRQAGSTEDVPEKQGSWSKGAEVETHTECRMHCFPVTPGIKRPQNLPRAYLQE